MLTLKVKVELSWFGSGTIGTSGTSNTTWTKLCGQRKLPSKAILKRSCGRCPLGFP